MRVELFDFELPEALIALRPARPRDSARLLHVPAEGAFEDRIVRDAPSLFRPGDVLVFNDTRVIPARLSGVRVRAESRVAMEATLIERASRSQWIALAKPGKRLREGDRIRFGTLDDRACLLGALDAVVAAKGEDGKVTLAFDLAGADLDAAIAAAGAMPLPPYIAGKRAPDEEDVSDYQTVYAAKDGAVAAPTAGLHFTPELLARLDESGVERTNVTLHVGAGTFLPVKVDDTSAHKMHAEWREISPLTADAVNRAKAEGRRVIAIGTTALRSLESAADEHGLVQAQTGATDIFITPGYRFRVVDGLWTNFHLPRSTLFMLVSAFAGLERMQAAYAHAIAQRYRFYSYGDASLLWRSMRAMTAFPFAIHATDGAARTGVLRTPRGDIRTPAFMPVGTAGTVKALTVEQVAETGADIILGNTYHLMLRPGGERLAKLGGLHRFMGWEKPILTDSGGYQVMSLAQLRKLDGDGVTFRSHVDGSMHRLTPERAIELQADMIGADIAMQLDECPALPAPRETVQKAMELSLAWAERCKRAFGQRHAQNLFAIAQGGTDPLLRRQSADALVREGFDGYAIGGLAVGEGHDAMLATLDATVPHLPSDRPRYLMGVGKPIDIVESVARGIDMFDCVLPTRSGRHGQAWSDTGPITLTNARFAEDSSPLDETLACPASSAYSKAYLHHLFKAGEILGQVLLSWHNLAYYQSLMERLRAAIAGGQLQRFRERFAAGVQTRGLEDN